MAGAARCSCNTRLNPVLCGRRNVRSADAGIIAADKRADEVIEPICIRHAVRVRVGKHFAFGSDRPSVAGVT